MPIGARRPFTEIFECAQTELVREAATGEESKYRGFVNQVYLNDLVAVLPEKYIRKKGYITTVADYTTGTVTVGSGTSNIIGSSTSWTSGNSNDFNILVSGFNRIYRMTFVEGTSLTFQDSLTWVESSTTGATYRIFQNRYTLASDFSYMVSDDPEDPNVVSFMVSGNQQFVPPMTNDEYNKNYNDSISTVFSGYTVKYNSNNNIYIELWPNPDQVDILGYNYVPILTSLSEYTSGTVTFTNSTAVIGVNTLFTALNTANVYYIRNDVDGIGSASIWTKISSVANATALTLGSSFSGTTGASQTYTISEASKWPERFDDAILYKTAMIVDPDNVQIQKWQLMYQEAVGLDKATEAKRNRQDAFKVFPGMKRKVRY